LANPICVTAELAYLVPARFDNAMGAALKNLGGSLQGPLTPATELVFVSPHAQGQPTCAGCDPAAQIMNVGSACILDCLYGADHAMPEFRFSRATRLRGPSIPVTTSLDIGGLMTLRTLRLLA
jgi:hypothetical protein